MSKEFLRDRQRALEDVFFVQQNQALRRSLKEAEEKNSKKDALAAASGVTDDAVLEKLVALGMDASTLAALTLAPLVLVAWADGEVDARERAAVLSAAAEVGVEENGQGRKLLDRWLATRPPHHLITAWTDYIRAISPRLDEAAKRQLKADLLDRAHKVAGAAGGILGIGSRTSSVEKEMLARLEKAFHA
jgi:tellurite resistance protein